MKYTLAVHGGAGTILQSALTPELEAAHRRALEAALTAGADILSGGGAALDAVEAAVKSLEDCPLFNAGRGSVFTHEGLHETDAALMCGKSKNAGAVSLVTGVQNPISLCRKIIDESEHVFLAGKGAEDFARLHGLTFRQPEWFFSEYRHRQLLTARAENRVQLDHSVTDEKHGTVGAVAMDTAGNLAAATSTGGLTNKKYGRIGDSSVIGSGTYADNATCAVSCTGYGEVFLRGVAAYDVACLQEYKNLPLAEAVRIVIHEKLGPAGGDGGLIAADARGNLVLDFNSAGMYRGQCIDGKCSTEIF